LEDWPQVLALADQAEKMGYVPGEGISSHAREWLPMISVYLHENEFDKAGLISDPLIQYNNRVIPMLCATWQEFSLQGRQGQEKVSAWMDRNQCSGE
jgi:hypothetical protein